MIRKINSDDFYDKKNQSINLSTDLNRVGFPDNYVIHFEAHVDILDKKGYGKCSLIDSTNGYMIPTPTYTISALPNSIDLRPGDEKSIQIKVTTGVIGRNSTINFSSQFNKSLIDLQFIPNSIIVPPLGTNTSIVKIKA